MTRRNADCRRLSIEISLDPFRTRGSNRLGARDYTSDGAYFVTVCTTDRAPLFGTQTNGSIRLNEAGHAVADAWQWLPTQYPYVSLDEWCVMPDHLHGIIVLGDPVKDGGRSRSDVGASRTDVGGSRTDVGGSRTAPTGEAASTGVDVVRRKPLGRLIGAFKTVSTKRINLLRQTPGAVLWQRDFWDHIVRDADDLHRIRAYIRDNPRL